MLFLRSAAIAALCLTTLGQVSGQDFVNLPTGVLPGSFGASLGQSDLAETLEGFSYSLNATSSYQSNLNLQSSGGSGSFALGTGANLSYRTAADTGALLIGVFSYSPGYQKFFSGIDTPGQFQQAATASLVYSGNLLSGSLGASFSSGGGSNRLAGGFVDSSQTSVNGSVSWNYSPKTSLGVSANYARNDFGGNSLNGSQTFSFGGSASWQATPLVRVGPYLNYSRTTSDFAGSLDAVGFGLNVSYELSGKTSLSGALGFQNQSFERGGGGVAFVGSLTATWQPDDLYRVSAGFSTSTIASPTIVDQFVNNYDFNVGVSRPLGEGSLSLGTSLSFSQFESTDDAAAQREERSICESEREL